MKAYEIQEFGVEKLALVETERPKPGKNDVLINFRAASLNYRDLMMINGWYNPKLKMPLVPFSDGAGEIVEVGENVSKWKAGDRVMPIFMQGWINGGITYEKGKTALGGDLDGCLREFGAFHEESIVAIPEHLSFEEAATLPCAAVTAWHALKISGSLKEGETVLLLGTGGVSIFALQFAKHMNAEIIITSSSDEKLGKADILGADRLINYRENPDWDEAVSVFTAKRGVDHVVEVGGAGTLQKSLSSVRVGGHIAVIGVLARKGDFDPVPILMKSVRLQGIYVGSRAMFEEMNEFISEHLIKPVVDRTFEFGDVTDALKHMESGSHFGKIVVRY
ncbi:MAG: NAD(P)-dependent alcohol dehydrogenase [Pyrinomonadaceae bacterium]